ncbi:MAG: hypothetical protein GY783_20840 [Gammaproteobacteria bacterium]|nr:hypothetical protein [Gammaproteobacteria bacterium]
MANEPNVSSVPGWPYVYVNPDGTAVPVDIDSIGSKTNSPVQVPLAASTYVDDFTALQLGMWMILNALEFTTIDRLALVTSGRIESNTRNFTRIFLDWPEAEDGAVPRPSATIHAPQGQEMTLAGPVFGDTLIDETQDVYAPGTVLKSLYALETDLVVSMIMANTDDRAGVRKGIINAFSEPGDQRSGRRVLVPWYFEREARYTLQSIAYDDDAQNAQANIFPMTARFKADIEVVSLVESPVPILPPNINVDTDST